MYVLCYPFDPKMKLVVGNMLLLLLLSEKIKILFRKSAEFMSWVFLGWVFFWHCNLYAVLCFFIWKFMGKIVLLFVRSLKTLYMFIW